MYRWTAFSGVLLALGIWAMVLPANAADVWEVLFDGTSMDKWRGFKRADFPQGGWKVEDGVLKTIVGGDRADRLDIVTKKEYGDFELELEWQVVPGGNSGVFYRVSEEPQTIWHYAPEIQILDDGGHRDGSRALTAAGSLYALVAPSKQVARPAGQWNQFRIVLRGSHGEHWLNGAKVVEYDLDSPELAKLIAESKFAPFEKFGKVRRGPVALQHHGQEVWFRNIRIRSLDK